MRVAVAGWLCVQVCPPDRPPLPRPAMSMDHGTASRKPVLEEGVGERGAIIPWYGVGWQITGAKIPRPTPLGFFYLIDSAGRRGKGGGGCGGRAALALSWTCRSPVASMDLGRSLLDMRRKSSWAGRRDWRRLPPAFFYFPPDGLIMCDIDR